MSAVVFPGVAGKHFVVVLNGQFTSPGRTANCTPNCPFFLAKTIAESLGLLDFLTLGCHIHLSQRKGMETAGNWTLSKSPVKPVPHPMNLQQGNQECKEKAAFLAVHPLQRLSSAVLDTVPMPIPKLMNRIANAQPAPSQGPF